MSTLKQDEIMAIVCNAASRGLDLTVNQLMKALSYQPQRAAMHCSLKFLKNAGYIITVNRGRNGGLVKPTVAGMDRFKPKPML
jgi:hypothetical protein